MKFYKISIILYLLLAFQITNAQEEEEKEKNWSLSGYVTYMQSEMFQDVKGDWISDNLIHNRLNFEWYPSGIFSASIQVRNRFMYGELLKITPGYDQLIAADNGYWNLSRNLLNERSFLLNSAIDRAYLKYSKGKLEITAGRQRINWGRSFVWNPNDIFNAYSFFDFDYEEKPGSDAIRVQYYSGVTSSLELAGSLDENENITAAGMFHWNMFNYDFQMMAGILKSDDFVGGMGWEGNILNAGFRGEMSYFRSKDNFSDTTGIFVASVGADYTFSNSLMIQVEALYNELPDNLGITGFDNFYYMPLSSKMLSFTEVSLFAQASYPITPLLNAGLSSMYYPDIKGYFLGPSLEYSLRDDLYLMFLVQSFEGELVNNLKTSISFAFLRLKMNF